MGRDKQPFPIATPIYDFFLRLLHEQFSLFAVPFSKAFRTWEDKKNILTDSIPKGICLKEFNIFISKGNTKTVSFPGATSKKILHYLDIHMANSSTDMAAVHVGINDLLDDNTHPDIVSFVKNLNSMVQKCNDFSVRNVFIS